MTGSYSPGRDGERAQLLWVENRQAYVLNAAAGTSAAQLVQLARLLHQPSADEWKDLVFPDGPRDFPDDAFFRGEPSVPLGP